MQKNQTRSVNSVIPFSLFWAAGLPVLFTLYMLIFGWATDGAADFQDIFLFAVSVIGGCMILLGMPSVRVLSVLWTVFYLACLVLALVLADFNQRFTVVNTISIINRIVLLLLYLLTVVLLFLPPAKSFFAARSKKA